MSSNVLRRMSIRLVAATIVATTALAWQTGVRAQAQAPMSLTSRDAGVTVKVTPKPITSGAVEWEFALVLDTHSSDLSDDLLNTAVLVVNGQELRPAAWSGSGPGGHHREGVLKFNAGEAASGTVELRIQRPGEASARTFRWEALVSR